MFTKLNTQNTALPLKNRGESKNIKFNSSISICFIKYVPRELIARPKRGFDAPIERWLRGLLRDWAESFLSESHLRQKGFIETTQFCVLLVGYVNVSSRLVEQ
jgi:hypothetical protein